jgi:putative ABC transport system permease protein
MRKLDIKLIRDIGVQWAQFLSLLILVALGVACFVGLNAAYKNLSVSYEHTYDVLKLADAQFEVQSAPANVVDQIAAIPSVQAVEGRTVVDTGMFLPNGDQIRARLIGAPTSHRPVVNDLHIQSGRYLQPGDTNAALMVTAFAKYYDFGEGTQLRVVFGGQEEVFNAVGVAASPEYLFLSPSEQEIIASPRDFAVLFVPQEELARLTNTEGMINQVGVLVTQQSQRSAVIDQVDAVLGPYGLGKTTLKENLPSAQALRLDLEGYREIAFVVPAMILVVVALTVYITLSRLVQGQRVQVGLAKAIGYSSGAIVRHYLVFSLAVGILGSVIGILGGVAMGNGVTRVYADELGIPLVSTRFYIEYVVGGVLLSLIFCVLGGVWPARSAARMEPAQAMRLDPSMALVTGRVPLLERILGRVLRLPMSFRLALRNVFRVRRRSLASGLGVVFALMLVLSIWSMFDSIDWMLKVEYTQIERWDVSAVLAQPQPPTLASTVEGWPGVTRAEATLQLPGQAKVGSQAKDVLIVGMTPAEDSLHHLRLGGGKTPGETLGSWRVVMTPILVKQLGLKVGDTVLLDTPYGSHDFTLSDTSAELIGGTSVFVSLSDAQTMVGAPVINGLYLQVASGQTKAVSQALYSQAGAAAVQIKQDSLTDFRSIMGLIYVFMGVLLAFCLIVAAAILFNAITASVLERQREVATLRALGEGRARIALSIALENLILWALALVPGLVLGYAMAQELGAEFTSELFTFEAVIYTKSYAIVAFGVLATMMIAALPGIRWVNRLRLAEATKVLT